MIKNRIISKQQAMREAAVKKTLTGILVAAMAFAGYHGWKSYQTSVENRAREQAAAEAAKKAKAAREAAAAQRAEAQAREKTENEYMTKMARLFEKEPDAGEDDAICDNCEVCKALKENQGR